MTSRKVFLLLLLLCLPVQAGSKSGLSGLSGRSGVAGGTVVGAGTFNFKRPGGTDTYHRPDTTSLYKRF